MASLLEEKNNRLQHNKFETMFFQDHRIDENGQDVSRENYKAHLEFFKAGSKYNERAFIAANRAGKTIAGAFEMTCHLTGRYPDWWEGKKFDKPIKAWAVGKLNETTRDVLQYELLGRWGDFGSGMIPKDVIVKTSSRAGVPNAIQDAFIKHVSGGISELGFKAYQQDVDSFMGTTRHVIWHDEECLNAKIYSECYTRTMTVGGMMYTTFTPLNSLSKVVMKFFPGGKIPSDGIVRNSEGEAVGKYTVNCDWDDAPHLTDDQKKKLYMSYDPYEREARSRGIPSLGSGAVYPVFEEDVVVDSFQIPKWFKRAFGMDFGYGMTSAVWGAQDPDTGIIYLYSEHHLPKTLPPIHAEAIRMRGDWIIGACDPAGGQTNAQTGLSTIHQYEEMGLLLFPGHKGFKINAVEPGIAKVLTLLESGQLKVFDTLANWLDEFRVYRREEDSKGDFKIVKRDDHLMDATRYLIYAWDEVADTFQEDLGDNNHQNDDHNVSDVTGY